MRILVLIFAMLLPVSAFSSECKSGKSEEFTNFFTRFANDKMFATSRITWPLPAIRWEFSVDEAGNDEYTPVRTLILQEQYSASPSLSEFISQNNMKSKIQSLTANTAVVEIFKEDTDWSMTYHFSLTGNCWVLQEFQNHSL
jgi:hypothetical protein